MGSWIGVCTIGSFLSLNAWVQDLTNETSFNSTICDIRHFPKESVSSFSNFLAFNPDTSDGIWQKLEEDGQTGRKDLENTKYSNISLKSSTFRNSSKSIDELLYYSFIRTGVEITDGSTNFVGESGFGICEQSCPESNLHQKDNTNSSSF